MIWLIGAKGMLGKDIAEALEKRGLDFVGTDIDVDITNFERLKNFAEGKNISWIINASGYTAVDKTEDEEDIAYLINSEGVSNIASVAASVNAPMIHFSSDYVFDGNYDAPYKELDAPCPISAYGRTKLAGERLLMLYTGKFFIFRMSWLYGHHGRNFVKRMLDEMKTENGIDVVFDQFGAPTYTKVMAENIAGLVSGHCDNYGIYHYADEGIISWHTFALKIQELALKKGLIDKKIPINAIITEESGERAVRPLWAVFDKTKVQEELGFKVVDWEVNLESFLDELSGK